MSAGSRLRAHYAQRTLADLPALNVNDFVELSNRLAPLVIQYAAGQNEANLTALNARIAELRGRLDSLDAAVAQLPEHFKRANSIRG